MVQQQRGHQPRRACGHSHAARARKPALVRRHSAGALRRARGRDCACMAGCRCSAATLCCPLLLLSAPPQPSPPHPCAVAPAGGAPGGAALHAAAQPGGRRPVGCAGHERPHWHGPRRHPRQHEPAAAAGARRRPGGGGGGRRVPAMRRAAAGRGACRRCTARAAAAASAASTSAAVVTDPGRACFCSAASAWPM